MSSYHSSMMPRSLSLLITIILCLTFTRSAPLSLSNKLSLKKNKNDTHLLTDSTRYSLEANKLRNMASSARDRFKSNQQHRQDEIPDEDEDHDDSQNNGLRQNGKTSLEQDQLAYVVVLTSLSGVYVWWPSLFGGDDSFHLLLNQEDVPRFHDVTGDEHGHIYLTAPHERTVYRLQYDEGWWISNFSNHSVMNSIRSEMPLFLNIHHVSSIIYVYGHSDIQTIDLLDRSGTRGSAPFMKRLRELSPNLRISDMIIDQLTGEGYIIGDSYGWCTVIRCSLAVSECAFLFKIPSSYDNRPYPCTATIDFNNKIMYMNLEERILAVYLNEQTNFDRRFVLAEKSGPRSTLGYDDIITHNQTVLYTDVLRPLLHVCQPSNSNACVNMSLTFSSPHRTILPLRLSIIQAPNLRPPTVDDEDENEPTDSPLMPPPLVSPNQTSSISPVAGDAISNQHSGMAWNAIWILLFGIAIGLILSAFAFAIYQYITKNSRSTMNQRAPYTSSIASSIEKFVRQRTSSSRSAHSNGNGSKSILSSSSSSDPSQNQLLDSGSSGSTERSSSGMTSATSTTTTTTTESGTPSTYDSKIPL